MNLFELTLAILIVGILLISLIYTLVAGRQQKVVEGEMDTQIANSIQKNVYTRNPIFLSYGIFFALVLFIILFVAVSFY
ncbi:MULTISPECIES: hypothetical protein [Neobacillus]|jgi:hypothetical protein|uniref:Short-chain dehydrogenase n=1 Tax=Neobacillus sedimentimangrovi TaxID=2699460 RepID=A0ABS8QLJ8_9BACI|nr:hypothetical protein [Neobacillus sedimentimangrovi]AIM17524.1 hypothetical protein HW35_15870 [Bacillus sp. X1(2014)]MCD4840158.1 hypothetical protein [Neobacillus sedimentimangrovi]